MKENHPHGALMNGIFQRTMSPRFLGISSLASLTLRELNRHPIKPTQTPYSHHAVTPRYLIMTLKLKKERKIEAIISRYDTVECVIFLKQ